MLEGGFILLHRSILRWEWYGDLNTARLFIHLLLTVNLRAAAVAGHCGGARAARGEPGKAGGRDGADRQAGAGRRWNILNGRAR